MGEDTAVPSGLRAGCSSIKFPFTAGLAFGKEGIPFLALEIGLFVLAIIGMVLLFPQGEDASCSLDTGAMPSFTIDMPNPNAFDLETTPDTNLLIAFKDKEFDFTDRDAKLFDFNDKQCLPPCCEGDEAKCATGCSDSMLDCLEKKRWRVLLSRQVQAQEVRWMCHPNFQSACQWNHWLAQQ